MSDLNAHHEEEYQDMTYLSSRIGRAHKDGRSIEALAIENRLPTKTIQELVRRYNDLYN